MRSVLLSVLVSAVMVAASAAAAPVQPLAPLVKHTAKGPTGYEVTFRYRNPTAKRVQIKGEWYFADPTKLPLSSTFTSTIVTPALTPKDWKPGFFPIQSPNDNGSNFPVVDMTKGPGGVWTYTTPLPSGVFNYGFFVDCADAAQRGCRSLADPSNPSWNRKGGGTAGSTPSGSQVYVPSDPAFGTVDYSWQAPSPTARGRLEIVTYHSRISANPTDQQHLTVYTPPGYDPARATPYPTLYLAHGNGGDELSWTTEGAAGDILDNLIATGQIRPLVVVMPSADGLPGRRPTDKLNQQPYIENLIGTVIPLVEGRYHVSKAASDRAMAGLSAGSGITNAILVNNTSSFAYYGSFSRGPSYLFPSASDLSAEQIAAIRQVKGVFVGAGWEERLHPYSPFEINTLTAVGAPVSPEFVHGGHGWHVWRQLLRSFLVKVAFMSPINAPCPQCTGPFPN